MTIPNFQALMLPLLRIVGDGNEHELGEVNTALADEFGLSAEETGIVAQWQASTLR